MAASPRARQSQTYLPITVKNLKAKTWSINWDRYDGYNFSAPVKATLKTLP